MEIESNNMWFWWTANNAKWHYWNLIYYLPNKFLIFSGLPYFWGSLTINFLSLEFINISLQVCISSSAVGWMLIWNVNNTLLCYSTPYPQKLGSTSLLLAWNLFGPSKYHFWYVSFETHYFPMSSKILEPALCTPSPWLENYSHWSLWEISGISAFH